MIILIDGALLFLFVTLEHIFNSFYSLPCFLNGLNLHSCLGESGYGEVSKTGRILVATRRKNLDNSQLRTKWKCVSHCITSTRTWVCLYTFLRSLNLRFRGLYLLKYVHLYIGHIFLCFLVPISHFLFSLLTGNLYPFGGQKLALLSLSTITHSISLN